MVLAYQSRSATKDIDALILSPPAALVRKWIQQVAREQELPEDWHQRCRQTIFGNRVARTGGVSNHGVTCQVAVTRTDVGDETRCLA